MIGPAIKCPDRTELAALADRELPERRADHLRAHVAGCSVCTETARVHQQLISDLRAPALESATGPIAAKILARLDTQSARRSRPWLLASGAFALAAAATLVVSRTGDRETMQARGGHEDLLARHASANLYTVRDRAKPVMSGSHVLSDARFVVGYRNLDRRARVYLIAFAVDSANTIHWLYPAYERPTDDPQSIDLPVADRETLLPDSIALERPALGPLRVVIVIGHAPERVREIETLPPENLAADRLRVRWPDALITETKIDLGRAL
ncbi:MAG: hypothetical protein JWO36_4108 [Myxococcales bacterium]|nr:hypothetical protein [Myxococcales bacterium]